MFESVGRVAYRRRRLILVLAAVFMLVGGVWGTQVLGELKAGGRADPAAESSRAQQAADDALGRAPADVVVIYRSADRTVDDPGFREAVESTVDALPPDLVDQAVTTWSTGSPGMVSDDGHATYVGLRLVADEEGAQADALDAIEPDLDAPGLAEEVGGGVTVARDINAQVGQDLALGEAIAMPVVFVLLVLILGGLVAAATPVLIGGLAILGAFTALHVLSYFTDVSSFALNIVMLLGLGLAIDYGLFIVSRYREELTRGHDRAEALARTTATAGRTVAVSALILSVALSGLTFFPQMFLRSMGMGGIAAVLIAALGAVVVLPALLAALGPRIDSLSVRRKRSRRVPPGAESAETADSGWWARLAHSVMRRPVIYATAVTVLLVVLATPFLRIDFGGVDTRVLPEDAPSRVAAETLEADFPGQQTEPIVAAVELDGPVSDSAGQAGLDAYVDRLADLDGVTGVQVTGAEGDVARVSVAFDGSPTSDRAQELVQEVRATPGPAGAEVLVGGGSAELVDLLDGLGDMLPWVALLVAVATFVLLFLAFGSIVLPLKAMVMNVISLGATFGAIVWIFQDGNLAGVLGFTPTGEIDATQPILMLAIAFGLSMDYEVFLLSRIREQYDRTGDNRVAVAGGVQRTGRIISSAALLLVVVVAAFSLSGITFIKMIGVGMAIAIIVDATLVRMLLVPATMRLLGRANWWAPGPLRRLYARYGIREDGPAGGAPGTGEPDREPVGASR